MASFSCNDNSDTVIVILEFWLQAILLCVGQLSNSRTILTACFPDVLPLDECLFFYTSSGVPQSNNQFLPFKSEYGEVSFGDIFFFLNQAMTHIGLMFMLTLLANTFCIADIEVLSPKAYHCSPRISAVSNNA